MVGVVGNDNKKISYCYFVAIIEISRFFIIILIILLFFSDIKGNNMILVDI